MTPEDRLARQGLALPVAGAPAFDYEPLKIHGDVVYLAGQLAKEAGEVAQLGRVGAEIDEAEGMRQMQLCALHSLAWLKQAAGGSCPMCAGYCTSTPISPAPLSSTESPALPTPHRAF